MEESLFNLLGRLEAEGAENDARETDRKHKFLNLERPTAELVAFLVRITARRRVLEIGTSNGYSTLWIAEALSHTYDARLTTIERDPIKLEQARSNLKQVKLDGIVEFLEGDATEIVRELVGPLDCVFFDADRVSAPEQLELLLPHLQFGTLLMADNALSHPEEIAGYRKFVEELPTTLWTLVPVGKGLHVAWFGVSEQ